MYICKSNHDPHIQALYGKRSFENRSNGKMRKTCFEFSIRIGTATRFRARNLHASATLSHIYTTRAAAESRSTLGAVRFSRQSTWLSLYRFIRVTAKPTRCLYSSVYSHNNCMFVCLYVCIVCLHFVITVAAEVVALLGSSKQPVA